MASDCRAALAAAFLLAACSDAGALEGGGDTATPVAAASPDAPATVAAKPALGLFTTLPLMWGESAQFGGMLDGDVAVDPIRSDLEQRYVLAPLDTLSATDLAPLDRLLMIQPRVLGDVENVALDDWVRRGGRLVLFADPALTRDSIYPLGDKRRPQDTVVLSPILARWGLRLEFPDDGILPETIAPSGVTVPLREAGRLALVAHDAPGECQLSDSAVVARCRIGQGQVLVIADGALFDGSDNAAANAAAAGKLIDSGLAL